MFTFFVKYLLEVKLLVIQFGHIIYLQHYCNQKAQKGLGTSLKS